MSTRFTRRAARVCGSTRSYPVGLISAAALLSLSLLTGCGGGGSTTTGVPVVNNPTNGLPATTSNVSGSVTDINGAPVIGATVKLNDRTTTTTQGGTYFLSQITVPANQASLVTAVTVSATVNGKAVSGQNTVEVLNGEANTANVNIVVSDSAAQGSISGTVRDAGNNTLPNSRVFVAPGPVQQSNGGQAFTNFSSFTVYADNSGRYLVPKLPLGVTYTVLASYVGHLNQSLGNVTLTTSNTTGVDFHLSATNTSPTLPAVQNFGAFNFTWPASPTRSVTSKASSQPQNAIKAWVLKARGVKQSHFAPSTKTWTRATRKRDTPAGALIETDLVWDYQEYNNLLGYSIVRSINNTTSFQDIATLRDPLADRYDDLDIALTPGTSCFYNVGRLDTINFPNNIDTSNSVPADVTIQVQPLNPIQLQTPGPNAAVNGTPTFSWNTVTNAGDYQVLVYDRFPDYQSDANGVAPIWPQNSQNPGNSLVSAPSTQTTYNGPALQSGHTYYVVVLAQYAPANNDPSIGTSVSVSPIQAFTVQ